MKRRSTTLRYETHDTPLRMFPKSEEHTTVEYPPIGINAPHKTVPQKMGYFYVDDYEALPIKWDYLLEENQGAYNIKDDETSMGILPQDEVNKVLSTMLHEWSHSTLNSVRPFIERYEQIPEEEKNWRFLMYSLLHHDFSSALNINGLNNISNEQAQYMIQAFTAVLDEEFNAWQIVAEKSPEIFVGDLKFVDESFNSYLRALYAANKKLKSNWLFTSTGSRSNTVWSFAQSIDDLIETYSDKWQELKKIADQKAAVNKYKIPPEWEAIGRQMLEDAQTYKRASIVMRLEKNGEHNICDWILKKFQGFA